MFDECHEFLEISDGHILDTRYSIYYDKRNALMEDISCKTCGVIEDCNYLKVYDKFAVTKQKDREKEILAKKLTKGKQ